MTELDNIGWQDKELAYRYLEGADTYVVERQRFLEIICSYYKYFLGDKEQHLVLDLGCGDGIVVDELLKVDGSIRATLIDGSEDMLDRARKRLAGHDYMDFIKASFSDMLNTDLTLPSFDLVVSSLAIHHLKTWEKEELFQYIYAHLKEGASFVNVDVILPHTEILEGWYLELWREWVAKQSPAFKGKEETLEQFISRHNEESHHRNLDTLDCQLDTLKSIGFEDVDCFYKYGIFAAYGGRR
jgi:tRNA (cmo5U34)-methyltransferase